MVEHIQRVHQGNWECKLPGCQGSKSKFQYDRFKTHLLDHHDINSVGVTYLRAAYKGDESLFLNGNVVICRYCSKQRAQSDQSEVSGDQTA